MKKKLLPMLAWAGILLLVLSCGKDEVPELTQYSVPKALIKGNVFADLDLGSSGYETAISGLKIIVRVNIRDLIPDPDPDYNYGYKNYTGTVDQYGLYTVDVDATYAGLTVTMFCDDFFFEQKQAKIDSVQPAPVRRVYTAGPFILNNVLANKQTIKDIYYATGN